MIDVIWYRNCKGNWDHGLISDIFERNPQHFDEYNESGIVNAERAIIIVSGKPDVAHLRDYLNDFKSGIVILTSDEDAYFDYRAAVPAHLEVWTQYYTADRSDIKERLLLGVPNRFKDYQINLKPEKKWLWSFVGQVQNPFRQQCVNTLKKLPDGLLQEVEFFGGNGQNAVQYQDYLDIMCQSKYVICPAGSMSVDSFRLYEAMECGAIPITDARSPRDSKDFNYWNEVYPRHKVISVNFWDEQAMKAILQMPNDNNWWFQYKTELEQKLIAIANG